MMLVSNDNILSQYFKNYKINLLKSKKLLTCLNLANMDRRLGNNREIFDKCTSLQKYKKLTSFRCN